MKDEDTRWIFTPHEDAAIALGHLRWPEVDTPIDRRERHRMVCRQLRARGISSAAVLWAMARVPRHYFVASHLRNQAYTDNALPTGDGQTISQPYMVALMTDRLDVWPGHRVLEIGTGTGYQTAVLAMLARSVFTVERMEALSVVAQQRLRQLGCNTVHFSIGDGSIGWPTDLYFDRILVTAGAPDCPPALLRQLAPSGKLIIPIGDESQQILTLFQPTGQSVVQRDIIACRFVPLVGRQGWPGTAPTH